MGHNSIYAGELLVKLCELSRSHDVDIRVRQDPFNPNIFEIRLDRRDNHVASLIDITRTYIYEPEPAADYVFHRSLYEIKKMDEHKE